MSNSRDKYIYVYLYTLTPYLTDRKLDMYKSHLLENSFFNIILKTHTNILNN